MGDRCLVLKIDVDTYRGTLTGVPRLRDCLLNAQAGGTFLFSLGPDHTGRAIRRVFRPGFFKKVCRTSVLKHYGWRTLLYGTLLPGPSIYKRCASLLRSVRDAGFEVGVHTYDHIFWQDQVAFRSAVWTEQQMRRAVNCFEAVFGNRPQVHGAAGWQMNSYAYGLESALGFAYASDTRGSHPFIPVNAEGALACPQLPTTLPTLDELIGRQGLTAQNVAAYLLKLTETRQIATHVYTLHAELEGAQLMPVFEQLLRGWHAQGYRLISLQQLWERLSASQLPRHSILEGTVLAAVGPYRARVLRCLAKQIYFAYSYS